MTTYYAIPCPQGLRENFAKLLVNFEQNSKEPQNQLLIQIANDYTDKIIEVMVLGNSHMMDQEAFAVKLLHNVASAIKTTAHTLIKQVLSKMKNEEMSPLASQIRARKLVINDQEYISFPVPEHLAQSYKYCFAQIKLGDVSVKHKLMESMLEFSSLANHYFYVESIKPLKLGFVTRKIADLGGVTIDKASHAAIKKLVPQLNKEELQGFVEYLEPLFIDVN
ncbi:MAG TPA: hypothetical protein PKL69_02955 [Agitococcus sp.]|nr:hypothetical protein [Agitococcus sp.]HMX98628.1 hypothetical protein [Agitococcus sp.]HNE90897.1 hypothetical protein [Agitococcus sp.]HNI63655.1 hypothetical protein [Agitococcus sp.]HNJ86290.1 hypothetical protein [Agitococcus sp.]